MHVRRSKTGWLKFNFQFSPPRFPTHNSQQAIPSPRTIVVSCVLCFQSLQSAGQPGKLRAEAISLDESYNCNRETTSPDKYTCPLLIFIIFIRTYDLGQPHFVITHNPNNQSRHSKSSSSAHCKPASTLEPQRAFQAAVMVGEGGLQVFAGERSPAI
jgi:hypothetical protein